MPKKSTRRTHSAAFKFRIALQACRGADSVNEIAARENLHPAQVSAWKKELEEGGSALFERKNARNKELEDERAHIERLERTLGRTVVEKDFLLKKCEQLGIEP